MRSKVCISIVVMIFLSTCRRVSQSKEFDVVIVGGGLSGLAAASQLKDYRVAILEKSDRLGGRLFTQTWHGGNYELGALFGYDASVLPFPVAQSKFFASEKNMGLRYANQTFACKHVLDCISQAKLSQADQMNATSWLSDPSLSTHQLHLRSYKILNAFYRTIHSGEMKDYIKMDHGLTFQKISFGRFSAGNQELTDALRAQSQAFVRLGNEVLSVVDAHGMVKIGIRTPDGDEEIYARQIICATDAEIAQRILKIKSKASEKFLNSVRYKGGISVVLGVRRDPFPGMAYVVNPDSSAHVIFKFKNDEVVVLTVYYGEKEKVPLMQMSKNEIISVTLKNLKHYGVQILTEELVFSDAKIWDKIEPVFSKDSFDSWDSASLEPSPHVYLAGDYTHTEGKYPMPYGMSAAILSGLKASRHTLKQLRAEYIR